MLPAHRIWIVLVLLSGWLGLPLAAPADPPEGYYDSVQTTDAATLRATLHEVIDDHTKIPYTDNDDTDTWDVLALADEDPNNSSNILDVYKNSSIEKFGGGANGPYNREHTWPKSYGFPDNTSPHTPSWDFFPSIEEGCHAADAATPKSGCTRRCRFCSRRIIIEVIRRRCWPGVAGDYKRPELCESRRTSNCDNG